MRFVQFKSIAATLCVVVVTAGGLLLADKAQPASCGKLGKQYRVAIVAAGNEAKELAQICQQALATLTSPALSENLASFRGQYPQVMAAASSNGPQLMPLEALADVVSLKHPAFLKFRSHFVLAGTYFETGKVYTGQCYLGNSRKNCNAYEYEENRNNEFAATRVVTLGPDSILESIIGRKIHQRWHSASPQRRSCAINTFVHELMHSFSQNNPTGYHQNYFIDTLSLNQPAGIAHLPLATYFVGSVAQCTWLQQHGHLDKTTPALHACVEKFGSHVFNSQQCQ